MPKNAYLKAMGIDVWVERNPSETDFQEPESLNQEITAEMPKVDAVVPESKTSKTSESTPVSNEIINKLNVEQLDWRALHAQVSACQLCELSNTRTQTIFGTGNQAASLMIIGDDSNEQSSQLLTAMLKAMGYQRNDVYISNIIKCNIAENKEASEEQSESCEPYLLRQISLVQPKLILALGNAAAQRLLKSKSTMNRLRGQLHYIDGINAPILVSYHPTYLLASPNEKRKAWEDLQLAMKELNS